MENALGRGQLAGEKGEKRRRQRRKRREGGGGEEGGQYLFI